MEPSMGRGEGVDTPAPQNGAKFSWKQLHTPNQYLQPEIQ